MFKELKYFDWLFFASIALLSLFGLMMIYSTGLSGPVDTGLWIRQLIALARYLYDNYGLVGYAINQIAFYSTPIKPQAATDDPPFTLDYWRLNLAATRPGLGT